jgi:hypothetical protein
MNMPTISHLESMYGIFSSEGEFKQHLDRISNSSSHQKLKVDEDGYLVETDLLDYTKQLACGLVWLENRSDPKLIELALMRLTKLSIEQNYFNEHSCLKIITAAQRAGIQMETNTPSYLYADPCLSQMLSQICFERSPNDLKKNTCHNASSLQQMIDLFYDKYRTTLAAVPYSSPEPAVTENNCPGLSDSHHIFLINTLSLSSLPTLNQQTYEAPPTIQPPTAQTDTLSSSSLQLQNVLAVAALIIIVCAAIYKNIKSPPKSNFGIKDNDFLARKESNLSGARQLLPISPVPPSSSNLDSPVVRRRKRQNVQKDHNSEQTKHLSAEFKTTSTNIFKQIKKLTRALQNMDLDTPDEIQTRIDTVGTLKAALEQIFALNPEQYSFDPSFSFISSNSLIKKFYTSGEVIKKINDIDARMQKSFNWFCGILDQLPQLLFICHTQQIKTPPNPYAVKKVRQDYEILIKSMYNFMDEYIGYLQHLKTAFGQQNATQDPESAQDLNAPPLALRHTRFSSTRSSQFKQLTSKSH